ncbi:succinate dehydrogenase subunit 4, putative [Plasmodium sp. gorilla clade G2]|uniref:succinate dehydrogenase subunit 4, putative n=1 Tax=Plasmodium sp. gorilla clade G2 TaxID=880535 RepID=UPI000D205BF2|nr:succinate dehydrogenase subunit 4, putative [Plasmodium sp. gorilla clade G2]SOV14711.1 succinate dehydrogenase subunit 4, putative [Plasmodium sp. gorilla clade G2]
MKLKLNLAKKKKGFELPGLDGFKNAVNKLLGTGVERYFKIVNIAIVFLFLTIIHYIRSFNKRGSRYRNKGSLYMYYGFLVCLIGFAVSINWIYIEYVKNKKKKSNSPLDVKVGKKNK